VVSLDETCAEIMGCHAYPPALAHVLPELLGAAALLASTLKFNGNLIVQLQGDGPVRLLVVECDASLTLRATAQWTPAVHALASDAGLAALAGGAERGRLAITLDPKDGGPIYQGIVALQATSIASLIEHYLETSEQIPSRMVLSQHGDRVRGLLLQRLPGGSDADDALWALAAARADETHEADLLAAPTTAALLRARFPEHDLRLFRLHPTRFGCSCSQARVENALRLVGRVEVEDILAEQGEVRVTCEFCNRGYGFSSAAARALFVHDAEPGARH
jgi:molecular chaperone Hsp33